MLILDKIQNLKTYQIVFNVQKANWFPSNIICVNLVFRCDCDSKFEKELNIYIVNEVERKP